MGKEEPKTFYWGAATAAHQVEGGTHNDWSEWEKKNADRLAREAPSKWKKWQREKFPEMCESKNYISGRACDHFHRYEEDFDLAREGGHNAHRFSIEWSRIEPEEGKFDEKAMKHYAQVVKALRARGLEPFVTLWHYTFPVWFAEKGGWTCKDAPRYFSHYAEYVARNLGSDVQFWITYNEPVMLMAGGYLKGYRPPQKHNPLLFLRAIRNLAKAHKEVYDRIHSLHADAQVGYSDFLFFFDPGRHWCFLERVAVWTGKYFVNKFFFRKVRTHLDFYGVQYYIYVPIHILPFSKKVQATSVTDMGWEIVPEGLYRIIKDFSKYNIPLYITENGIADADDEKRAKFVEDHIRWMRKAMDEGVDVQGYFYWSLLDNFEWDKGFWPRFGLVEVDYKTLERKPRKSFYAYRDLIRENQG